MVGSRDGIVNRPGQVVPLVLVVCALGALGQTLLKLAISRVSGGALASLGALLKDPVLWVGGFTVAAGTLTWLYVMSRAQLTYAMPFLGMGFVLTMITSAIILHEPQPAIRIVGTVVIVAGMVLVGWGR